MKITVKRSDLAPALNSVAAVVERRQTLPILSHLLIETASDSIVLTATDLELQISSRVAADIIENGRITLPAKKFADICRVLPDDEQIELNIQEGKANVRCGRSRFSLSTLPADDYPCLDVDVGEQKFKIDRDLFYGLIERSSFAMAHQDVRYYLNGLLLEVIKGKLVAVATDGHRLAKAEIDMENLADWTEKQSVILPAKTVSELKRLLSGKNADDCELEFGHRAMMIRMANTIITTKLIDGRYPDYERVIPENLTHSAKIERETLRTALARTAVLSYEKQKGVRMTFKEGVLCLEVSNPEHEEAKEELEIEYQGEEIAIGFNVSYWLDALNATEGDWINVQFVDSEVSTILADPDSSTELYVIMPMRI